MRIVLHEPGGFARRLGLLPAAMLAVLAGTGGCTSRPGQAATGEGELELSDDGSELPFPAGFVEPADGSVVKIGRFEATLRATP